MKNIKRTLSILLILAISILFTCCNVPNENDSFRSGSRAIEDAVEAFKLDRILFCSTGASYGFLFPQSEAAYAFYIMGERENEEVFIIVPALKNRSVFEAKWPFAISFREIVNRLETEYNINYNWDNYYYNFKVLNEIGDPLLTTLKVEYDFYFFMSYTQIISDTEIKYYLCQKDGECLILPINEFLGLSIDE